MHFSLDAKYLESISCLQSNACRLTPCILLCTIRWTKSTWGALAVYKVTHVGSLHAYCSTLLCTFHWTQSTWRALAVYKVTHVGSLHVYCYALFVGRKVPGEH